MPSPFPGMDPYLEATWRWSDVHHEVISLISTELTRVLRPRYYARIEERVYVSDEQDPGRSILALEMEHLKRLGRIRTNDRAGKESHVGAIGPVTIRLIDDELHEPRVEIKKGETHEVVTVIEVLNPGHKVPGSRGRASFEEKREEVMSSTLHWVEIDLLRTGMRTVAPELVPRCEYFVHISEVAQRPKAKLWPIRLSQRLPKILIPLKPEDEPAPLDLQAVLDLAYDRAGYDLDINYQTEPVPPLDAEWSGWADRLLREKGKRNGEAQSS